MGQSPTQADQSSFAKIGGRHFGWSSFTMSVDCGATIAGALPLPIWGVGWGEGVSNYRKTSRAEVGLTRAAAVSLPQSVTTWPTPGMSATCRRRARHAG